jgi:hypothetical protein
LREARLFFQYALEDQFRAIVEQALERRTVAFISGIDTQRDVAMEVFTLEPVVSDGADEAQGKTNEPVDRAALLSNGRPRAGPHVW